MRPHGHVLIGVLVAMGGLSVVWMAEFGSQLEDRMRASRQLSRESLLQQAAAQEWTVVSTHLTGVLPEESPVRWRYSIDDVVGRRTITLLARWEGHEWVLTREAVSWRDQAD